jgi:hypothetical protein
MTRTVAVLSGVAVASGIAALFVVALQLPRRDEATERWRARAFAAERQLAAMRDRVASMAAQLQSVSARRESNATSRPVAASSAQEGTPPLADSPRLPPPAVDPALLEAARHGQQEAWTALVTGMLQSEVQRRSGCTLAPEQAQRLVATLARLRDASFELSETPLEPQNPLSLRAHLMRAILLLEADRTFRAELGVGVSDFLQGVDGDRIEEVFPGASASEPGS